VVAAGALALLTAGLMSCGREVATDHGPLMWSDEFEGSAGSPP
jgi:hypothetical protein